MVTAAQTHQIPQSNTDCLPTKFRTRKQYTSFHWPRWHPHITGFKHSYDKKTTIRPKTAVTWLLVWIFLAVNTETMGRVCEMFIRLQMRYLPLVFYAKQDWFSDVRKSSHFLRSEIIFWYQKQVLISWFQKLVIFLLSGNDFQISENHFRIS